MEMVSAQQLSKNFWGKLVKTNTCWIWQGKPKLNGYGRCSLGGRRYLAHRASYELHKGDIPTGFDVDHKCHNRMCVNPDHLQAVTRKENKENASGPYACNKSGVRGVRWDESRRNWKAQVTHRSRTYYVGRFDSIQDAEVAVIEMRNKLFTNNLLDRVA